MPYLESECACCRLAVALGFQSWPEKRLKLLNSLTVETKKRSAAHAGNLVFACGPFRGSLEHRHFTLSHGVAVETVLSQNLTFSVTGSL